MATNYKIAAEFSVVDRATAALNKMSGSASVFSSAWNRGVAQAQQRLEAFGKTVATAGKLAVGVGVGAAAAGLVTATKQYADFDQAIRAAGAAYGPAFSQAADFEDKIKGMGAAVRAVAAATEFDATQSANALKTLALAGVQSEQAVALLPGVANLATAAMTDMDEAVALAVGSLNTMGLMSDRPEVLAANMTRLSDVMAHTANSAYMSLQDVGAAISAGGSFFRTANNDLNVMSGSLTALAANSIKGAEAGTALRNVMTNLSAPTSKAQAALNAMRIQTKDAAGNMLPLPKIIGQFNKAMAGMGDAERNANLYSIFGKQNIAAVTALLNTGQGALEEYAAAAANSAGTVVANAEAMRGSLVNKFKVLLSALTELGFKFVDAFAVKGGGAIEAITKAVSEFDPKPLVSALSVAVNVIFGMVKLAWKLRYVIGVVAGAMMLWRTATMAAAVAIKLQVLWTKIATVAQWALNAALDANPIGAIIIAIAALIAIVALLVSKWNAITSAVDGFFKKIRDMEGVGGKILRFLVAPLEMVWNKARGVLDVLSAFIHGGFVAGIKMIGVAILQYVLAPVEALLQQLSIIPVIGDKFADWNNRMHDWLDGMRADILAGNETENEESEAPGSDLSMTPPTMPDFAAAQAMESMSREESVTTNRLEVSLAPGLAVRPVARLAPAFTLYSGRRG